MERLDQIRILHRPVKRMVNAAEPGVPSRSAIPKVLPQTPDLSMNYPADPRTLPPGVAGRPLVTVVHKANGRVLGGVTYMVDVVQAPQ